MSCIGSGGEALPNATAVVVRRFLMQHHVCRCNPYMDCHVVSPPRCTLCKSVKSPSLVLTITEFVLV
ncbi:hypothetical protein Y032_0052g2220 [Ancylostoma ceylanicum]|uniref:Uncharacterized protein n=1 Tax=Ancylostoma ceylanicum TaxID=53326 RepID=A0A016U933_9BILA|nr:hypothetical protein Y032_0052g2220 [Ancylostoma ceylanicum]